MLAASGEEAERGLAFGVLDQLLAQAAARGPDPRPPPATDDDARAADPLIAGASLLGVLGDLQRAGPVVLVVDDAHWADRPSLVALTFAIRRLLADQVLVVVSMRDAVDPGVPGGLGRLLRSDDTQQVTLDGLGWRDLQALSAEMGPALSARAAARLHEHTAGNPLHARALLEQLPHAAFGERHVPLPAPRSFTLLVLGRLADCGPESRDLVAAASVLGRRCPAHVVAQVAGLAGSPAGLDEAIAAQMLTEDPATGLVGIPHPLMQAAVYQQLGPVRRAALHRRAAEVVEGEPARLHHRVRAAIEPDAELAADLVGLGRRAVVAGDWSRAGEYLVAAARLSPTAGEAERATLEALECQLLLGESVDLPALAQRLRSLPPTMWRSYRLARVALVAGRLADLLDRALPGAEDAASGRDFLRATAAAGPEPETRGATAHLRAAGVTAGRIEGETADRLAVANDVGDHGDYRRRHFGKIEARIGERRNDTRACARARLAGSEHDAHTTDCARTQVLERFGAAVSTGNMKRASSAHMASRADVC